MFKWPNVFDIWNTYLTKFIQRYVSCFKTSSLQLDEISKFLDISAQVMLKVSSFFKVNKFRRVRVRTEPGA